ncbi:hypothetical protein WSM22_34890 [Cytophagales bacterium WSM2-2]|nr:hypothetical protein WSM22_34890 [Cytophagales bacterium WSM2-2]
MVAVFCTTQAQTDVPVKILPSKDRGLIKVLFVHENQQSVSVKFYNEKGLHYVDVIDKNVFQNGFLKRYDVSQVQSEDFWVSISFIDSSLTATYKMVKSKDPYTFEAQLEHTSLNTSVVASIN